jgi:hypothetical protein
VPSVHTLLETFASLTVATLVFAGISLRSGLSWTLAAIPHELVLPCA